MSTDPLFSGPSEVARLMREKDWSATSLGPPENWPQALRTAVRIMLTSRFSMWMGWGPELNFFYNDAYRPTLGAKHPQSLAMPFKELWAEIYSELWPRIDGVLTTGEATWDEGLLLFLERNGYPEETYHTFSYSPLPDDHGGIGGMLSVVTEETERVIGERRLGLLRELATRLSGAKTAEDVFRAAGSVLGSGTRDIPFAIAYLDADSERPLTCALRVGIEDHHPGAPAELGRERSPWPTASVLESGNSLVTDLASGVMWPSGAWTEPPVRALVLPIAQQGQEKPAGVVVAALNPFRQFDEAYHGFLRLFVGQIAAALSNARAYEDERRRAEALAALDRAKTAFFSNVSHEFRTPLTLMLGPLADLVEDRSLSQDNRHELQLVHRNGLRLLKLVNTMLDFSRIEAGRMKARYEPVELAQYTADLASVFRSATDRAGLRLVVSCDPVGEPVYVDRDMWEKIVFNLISNAFKFTLAGEIEIRLARAGSGVQLAVRDTGTGIPSEELPLLFDRFHRVEGSRGRTHEGTGIGLALVQELVKLHGGTIDVESVVDRGTTFTISIPLGMSHLPASNVSGVVAETRSAAGNAWVEEALRWLPDADAADTSGHAMAREEPPSEARIVLADDNADMRDYIFRLLGGRCEVEVVSNGRDALEAVRRKKPDVLLTDVMMPLLDGFGVLRELRADARTRDLPVLMLSARAGEESRVEALQAGADDYLVKPFAARELLARVDTLLLRSRIGATEEAARHRLEAVFAQAPAAIALLRGPEHRFVIANSRYLEIAARTDLVGKTVAEALPEVVDQGILGILDRVRETAEPFSGRSFRVSLVRKGGQEDAFFDFVYQPLVVDGKVDAIAVIAFEVTELERAKEAAEVANRAKDEFLAMLGHELRNPLAPILTALQLMKLRSDDGADRERTIIERQVKHLVGLVDDLLDVSRVTRGMVELRKERVELSAVVARAIEIAGPLLERHRHDLSVDVPSSGLVVEGDVARLSQIVSNLLTNAAKYTPNAGRIRVVAAAAEGQLSLAVIDSGIGIAPGMIDRVFEPFTQERQAIDRSQGGLGLGLAIVRSLVTLHGGTVTAASDGPGKGSTFTIRLPQAMAVAPPVAVAPMKRAAVRPLGAGRILVVDDNEDAALMLSDMLALGNSEVRVAHDGPTALEIAESFQPDVALLDIGLPVMDGFELASRFRSNPALRGTRLIAVTGYGRPTDIARAREAGFDRHLVKPVDLEELRAAIDGASGSTAGKRG